MIAGDSGIIHALPVRRAVTLIPYQANIAGGCTSDEIFMKNGSTSSAAGKVQGEERCYI